MSLYEIKNKIKKLTSTTNIVVNLNFNFFIKKKCNLLFFFNLRKTIGDDYSIYVVVIDEFI